MKKEGNERYTRAIKNLAAEERPREKAIASGFHTLTSAELMALLIGSGTPGESVVDLCQRILNSYSGKLSRLARASTADVSRFKGIGPAKAITILAALELARRYHEERDDDEPITVRSSMDVFGYIRWDFEFEHEEFWIITLNRAKRITGKYRISQGGTTATVVDLKMVMKVAIDHLADGIVAVHNHPSGNPNPSGQDDNITQRLREACRMLDMEFVDHIIVAGRRYYSYVDNGR